MLNYQDVRVVQLFMRAPLSSFVHSLKVGSTVSTTFRCCLLLAAGNVVRCSACQHRGVTATGLCKPPTIAVRSIPGLGLFRSF